MSRRLAKTGHASTRQDQSRRSVLTAGIALPLVSCTFPRPEQRAGDRADPALHSANVWLARQDEHERLGARWQQIESHLFKEHNWSTLTRAQRKRFPEKHEMDDLYDRMDTLHAENEALLAALPAIAATTREGIHAKLLVLTRSVWPEDQPEVHAMIASIERDYRALHGA